MTGKPRIRIGIVAGEVSGDQLGAGLIRALRARIPGVSFEGIGGPLMKAQGCRSLYPMEQLSIIGFESIGKYPEILGIRQQLAGHFLSNRPDVFIGIDVPDFNLGLEERLKTAGILTVHYVSPTVWAWRSYRIRKIRRAVDHMLTLFPFEAKYYRQHHVPVTFVGHPLADHIEDRYDIHALRRRLKVSPQITTVALLPGSRMSELKRHAELFVKTAIRLHQRNKDIQFIAPFVNEETKAVFDKALYRLGGWFLPVKTVVGYSHEAMAASDVILLASGTATLEAALLKKPMVVTYKVSWFSFLLIKLFVHVKLFSLPNILAGRKLVPEFIQRDATPDQLGDAVEYYLRQPRKTRSVLVALADIRRSLRRNADTQAAEAVQKILRKRRREEG